MGIVGKCVRFLRTKRAAVAVFSVFALVAIAGTVPVFAQVTPYDGDVATATGYWTAEAYDAIPPVFGIAASLYMLWFAWGAVRKMLPARRRV